MEIISPEQMAAKLDYVSPLKKEDPERESIWCIPFEYGGARKGTKISIALAKTISAELRADVAEAEKRELRRALDQERHRSEEMGRQASQARDEQFKAMGKVALLRQETARLRKVIRGIRKGMA
jgi:hypothetical protein